MGTMTPEEFTAAYVAAVAARWLPHLHAISDVAREGDRLGLTVPTTRGVWGVDCRAEVDLGTGPTRGYVVVNVAGLASMPRRDWTGGGEPHGRGSGTYAHGSDWEQVYGGVSDTSDHVAMAAAVQAMEDTLASEATAMRCWLAAAEKAAAALRAAVVAGVTS